VGRTFTVARAGVGEVDYFSAGVKYRLDDGTGGIILLIWQNVMEEVAVRYDLFPGSQVQVTGEIDEYEGDLEIVPQAGADVVLLARGERAPIEARATGNIGPPDEGRIFVVEGTVTRTEGDGWLRLWLNDGTGEILVFVPTRTVTYLPAGIGDGVRLRVTGEVDIYRGVVEIIPLAGADVEMP
jgi:DNA/RNA endonuclease YhcR with UshA esterase domain